MGPAAFAPRELYEAHNLALLWFDKPEGANRLIRDLLHDRDWAAGIGRGQQINAREMFGLDRIMAQWAEFLGTHRRYAAADVEPRPFAYKREGVS
jgi:hypothetical protein